LRSYGTAAPRSAYPPAAGKGASAMTFRHIFGGLRL
jgi:hypothetical protein